MASKAAPPSTAPSTPPMIAPTFFDLAVLRTIVDGVGDKTESAPKELATLLLGGVLVEETAVKLVTEPSGVEPVVEVNVKLETVLLGKEVVSGVEVEVLSEGVETAVLVEPDTAKELAAFSSQRSMKVTSRYAHSGTSVPSGMSLGYLINIMPVLWLEYGSLTCARTYSATNDAEQLDIHALHL